MFNFLCKIVEIIMISMLFVLHSVFKICFTSRNKWARFYFNYFIFYFTLLMTTLLFLPLFMFKGRNLENAQKFIGIYEYLGQKIFGIELTVRNHQVLAKERGAVMIANHQSSLEVLLFFQTFRNVLKKCMPISKKELLYLFPYGPTNYFLGTMFVKRNKGGYGDLDRIAKELIKEKAKVLIMPEGTRNHVKGTMLPFKRGAFYLAIKAQVPIIPIVISPLYFIDYDAPSFEKPRITMQVLDVVPTAGLTLEDVPELKERVRLQVLEAYQKLYHECMANSKNKQDYEYDSNGFVKLIE